MKQAIEPARSRDGRQNKLFRTIRVFCKYDVCSCICIRLSYAVKIHHYQLNKVLVNFEFLMEYLFGKFS